MSFALSVTRPPANGAAFGVSRTLGPLPTTAAVARETAWLLAGSPFNVPTNEAKRYALSLARKDHGTQWVHSETGLIFRTDPADNAPHPCPCCSRLVLPTDHEQAGLEDAYCLGCFTWDRNTSACLPANSAHPNPWTQDTRGARWHLEIVFSHDDDSQTGSDDRYSSGIEQPDEDIAAEIAWPGIHPDDIISLTITSITESEG